MPIGQLGAVGRLGLTPAKGAPFRITIGARVFERVTLDGAFVALDGQPLYMEI